MKRYTDKRYDVVVNVASTEAMTEAALNIVANWITSNSNGSDTTNYSSFVVWQCKALQNWKWLIGTTMFSEYFEVTYNGDKNEFYLDVYHKHENVVVKGV